MSFNRGNWRGNKRNNGPNDRRFSNRGGMGNWGVRSRGPRGRFRSDDRLPRPLFSDDMGPRPLFHPDDRPIRPLMDDDDFFHDMESTSNRFNTGSRSSPPPTSQR